LICSEENLQSVSELLQRTEIRLGDFSDCESFVNASTFVYFDPPYRPISKTASFTAYSRYDFDDAAQLRLASFYRLLDKKGAKLMLSNSDPKNENPDDHFFEDAYRDFEIVRVRANRMINCNAERRGAINELLIMNYPTLSK
jgi:DNA adenine methylase